MKAVHAVWFHLYDEDPYICGIYLSADKARNALARIAEEHDGKLTGYDTATTWRGGLSVMQHVLDDEE